MDYGEVLSQFLVTTVFPVLGVIVMALIGWVMSKLAQKFGVEKNLALEAWFKSIAKDALGAAEEWGAAKVKEGQGITGVEKYDHAIAWFLQRVPDADEADAAAWIQTMLGQVSGVGASGEKAVK